MKKKYLILTMSCNKPYYQALLGAVKDTWAKPLIQNKYDDITWFGYTACDRKHPKPMIDFEDHMIYVDCDDSLEYTYIKTQKAYNMIKDKVDFDYVIRTNSSIFINIKNLIKTTNELDVDNIYGRLMYNQIKYEKNNIVKKEFWLIWGFLFGMKKEYFDYAMSADKKFIDDCICLNYNEYVDDEIISLKINELLGENFNSSTIENTKDDIIVTYKPYKENEENIENIKRAYEAHQDIVVSDPNVVNNMNMVRFRSFYIGKKRTEEGHELEHLYELNNALNYEEDTYTYNVL